MRRFCVVTALLFLIASPLHAKVLFLSVISDNMVLQQQADVSLWGVATPGRKVTVTASWSRCRTVTTSDSRTGKWMVSISTPEAGGPYEITVGDGEKSTLRNVLIGEVWFCSGQSNMEMPVMGFRNQPVRGGAETIAGANASVPVRICKINKKSSVSVQEDSEGKVRVTFNVGDRGLSPMGTQIDGFELAGEDRVFHQAMGRIDSREHNSVIVSSPEVPNPVAVRYCFHNWCSANQLIYNSFGIPAAPFRTDDWSN